MSLTILEASKQGPFEAFGKVCKQCNLKTKQIAFAWCSQVQTQSPVPGRALAVVWGPDGSTEPEQHCSCRVCAEGQTPDQQRLDSHWEIKPRLLSLHSPTDSLPRLLFSRGKILFRYLLMGLPSWRKKAETVTGYI